MSNSPHRTARAAAPFPGLLQLCTGLLIALLMLFTAQAARADDEFLDPAVAFKFSARLQDPATIAVTFDIADGYYMYRERFKFEAHGARLGTPVIPAGKVKFDDTFQKEVETYRHSLTITIPVEASGPFTLVAGSQGCSDKGLCYSPQEQTAQLNGAAGGVSSLRDSLLGSAPASNAPASLPAQAFSENAPAPAVATVPTEPSEMGRIEAALKGGKLLVIAPMFIMLGLFLAFTPCVLPMVPILSSIIVGDGAKVSRSRALLLSLTYALGMALVYTALGVAAGLAGEGLAARLQNPWVLGFFGLLMVALALSMFGLYELQMPAALQQKLIGLSNRQSAGKLPGVFMMGALSALIVGPCVTGPLAGILVYISQTGDVVVGGGALFSMAVGMSIPLILFGVSAGAMLPRAGAWMTQVTRFFGVLLLAVALWLVSPVLPAALQMAGWAALGIGYGMYLLTQLGHWGAKALGLVFALLGAVQLVGLVSGGRDALAPLAHLRGGDAHQPLPFVRIKSVAQLDAALAANGDKTAMLDFYADWCVSCKEMEKLTFVQPEVRAKLANVLLLQVDVTANDADDKAMLKRFNLFGPPGIILFDANGREIADSRVIGYQAPEKFLRSLSRLP